MLGGKEKILLDKIIEVCIIALSQGKGVKNMAIRANFYLSERQVKRLKMMSKKTGLSASELLRRAIDEYWERFKEKERR